MAAHEYPGQSGHKGEHEAFRRSFLVLKQHWDSGSPSSLFAVSVPGRMPEAVKEHDEIMAALQAGEGAAAERAVRLHIESSMGLLIRQWQLTETLLAG